MSDVNAAPCFPNSLSTNKTAVFVALVLMMLLGSLLRFQGLTRTGPYFIDQGNYMLGGWWYHDTIRLVLQSIPHWIQNPPEAFSVALSDIFQQAEGDSWMHPLYFR